MSFYDHYPTVYTVPIVSEATAASMQAQQASGKAPIDAADKALREHNPGLMHYINQFAQMIGEEPESDETARRELVIHLTHALLIHEAGTSYPLTTVTLADATLVSQCHESDAALDRFLVTADAHIAKRNPRLTAIAGQFMTLAGVQKGSPEADITSASLLFMHELLVAAQNRES